MKSNQNIVFTILIVSALCTFIFSCAERQDAILPSDQGNILISLSRTPVRGAAKYVDVVDTLAYVADEQFGISIYNIKDPLQPVLADSFDLMDNSGLKLVAVDSTGRIMAVQEAVHLEMYDLKNGHNMGDDGSLGHFEVELYWDGNILTVYRSDNSGSDGFNYERFTNDSPNPADSLSFNFGNPTYSQYNQHSTHGFAWNPDNIAFIALNVVGFVVVDYSVLVTAQIIGDGEINTVGTVTDATVSGDILCLAAGYEGLLIYNVAQPDNVYFLGSLKFATQNDIERLEITGNLVILQDKYDGIFAVDITDPTQPVWVGSLVTSEPYNFCIEGNLIIVADKDEGLVIGQILY